MSVFSKRMQETMKLRGIKASQLAEQTGLSKARISQYVNGRYHPKWDGMVRLAAVLQVSPAWLMGETDDPATAPEAPMPENVHPLSLRSYPVLGDIACGSPIFAYNDGEGGYVTAAETTADFCLTAKGDSMVNARICDGDEVFIQRTDMVNNGEIAAVAVDDEATLKRVFYYPDEQKLVLQPENPAYRPLTFTGEELNHVHILGRAVAVQAKLH